MLVHSLLYALTMSTRTKHVGDMYLWSYADRMSPDTGY